MPNAQQPCATVATIPDSVAEEPFSHSESSTGQAGPPWTARPPRCPLGGSQMFPQSLAYQSPLTIGTASWSPHLKSASSAEMAPSSVSPLLCSQRPEHSLECSKNHSCQLNRRCMALLCELSSRSHAESGPPFSRVALALGSYLS